MADVSTQRRGVAVASGLLLAAAIATGVVWWRHHTAPLPIAKPRPADARLEVRVAGPRDTSATGAVLTLTGGEKPSEARADADGRAHFGPMPPGPARLLVAMPGAARAARALQLVAGDNRLSVALEPAVVLAGVVADEAGTALAAVDLQARPESDQASVFSARSDTEGHFSFSDLAAGRYMLQARAEHHELAVLPEVQAPSAQPVRVVLQRVSALRGEVLDGSGTPAAGAKVTIAGSGVWPPKSLIADELGRFDLSPIPGGVYELRATRGNWTSAPREGLLLRPASEAFVSLRLEPGETLRGRVIDAESGQGLVGVTVTVGEDALASVPVITKTGTNGDFSAEGLRRLPQRIWVRAPGYVAIVGEERLPGLAPHELALRRAAVLAGEVVDERGQSVAEVDIEITGTTDSGEPMHVSPPSADRAAPGAPPSAAVLPSADNLGVILGAVPKIPLFTAPIGASGLAAPAAGFRTDASGHFRIEGVPAGKVQLIARRTGFAPGRTEPRAVRTGEQVAGLKLVLPRGAILSGRVLDGRGFPVSGVRVQLEMQGEPSPRVTLSGEDGHFELRELRGQCVVTAYPLEGPSVEERVALTNGERREIVLQLPAAAGELVGRVHDARGFPVEHAHVKVEAMAARSPTARTTSSATDGTFHISGLPAAPYRIRVEHPDYATTTLKSVSPTKQEEVSIELRAGARVFGIVLDGLTNDGVGGAQVRLRGGPGDAQAGRTDGRGKFEFRNITVGKYDVFVDQDGYMPTRGRALLARPEPKELDPLVLRPAGVVSGVVVDRLGAPVLDAEVALGSPPAWDRAVRTDRLGRFRVTGAEPGERSLNARESRTETVADPVPVRVYPRQESPGLVLRLNR